MTEQERFANMLLLPPDSFHIEGGVGTLSEKYLRALEKFRAECEFEALSSRK